jgi:hypothetical protein
MLLEEIKAHLQLVLDVVGAVAILDEELRERDVER